MWMHGYGGYGGLGGAGMILGLVFWVAAIAAVVALVIWLVRRTGQSPAPHHGTDAMAILKARYARGEINREQFEQMKRDLA
jgi:putative membrane protein